MSLDQIVRLTSGSGVVALLIVQFSKSNEKKEAEMLAEYKLPYEESEKRSASRGSMRAIKFISLIFLCVVFVQGELFLEIYPFTLLVFLISGSLLYWRLSSMMNR